MRRSPLSRIVPSTLTTLTIAIPATSTAILILNAIITTPALPKGLPILAPRTTVAVSRPTAAIPTPAPAPSPPAPLASFPPDGFPGGDHQPGGPHPHNGRGHHGRP